MYFAWDLSRAVFAPSKSATNAVALEATTWSNNPDSQDIEIAFRKDRGIWRIHVNVIVSYPNRFTYWIIGVERFDYCIDSKTNLGGKQGRDLAKDNAWNVSAAPGMLWEPYLPSKLVQRVDVEPHYGTVEVRCGFDLRENKLSYVARSIYFSISNGASGFSGDNYAPSTPSKSVVAKIKFDPVIGVDDWRIYSDSSRLSTPLESRERILKYPRDGTFGDALLATWTEEENIMRRDLLLIVIGALLGLSGAAFVESVKYINSKFHEMLSCD